MVRLSVPAEAASVHLLRTVIASVGARMSFTLDEIDDLRLAVDESAAELLRAGGRSADGELRMAVGAASEAIEVSVELTRRNESWPPPDVGRSVRAQILGALVDHVAFESDEGGVRVRLVKRIRGVAT